MPQRCIGNEGEEVGPLAHSWMLVAGKERRCFTQTDSPLLAMRFLGSGLQGWAPFHRSCWQQRDPDEKG